MKNSIIVILTVGFLFCLNLTAAADVKIRQKITMGPQSIETTKYIKGSRERTEQKFGSDDPETARMMPQISTITQCDLRRTIRLNDRVKLYLIDPFADILAAPTSTPSPRPTTQTRNGGIVTVTYLLTDTGERKTLFGLTARHLKILQEMESSPDSCGGANRSKMEFDGWYVDFSAEFNCPQNAPVMPAQPSKPGCVDRIVHKGGGAGKTGFLLNGTMKIYDSNGALQMTHTTETLELSRSPLPADLFEIPAGYEEVKSQEQLYRMPGLEDMKRNDDADEPRRDTPRTTSTSGAKSVSLNLTFGNNVKVDQAEVGLYLKSRLRENNLKTLSGAGGDYVLNVEIKQVKESTGGKLGGIFGKVTGIETKVGKVDVEINVSLFRAGSAQALTQTRVAQKFEATVSDAVHQALDQALGKIMPEIEK